MTTKIETPGGYTYDEPKVTGLPDVSINLPFDVAYEVLLDALECNVTIEPLTPPTFKLLAYNLLHTLIDESETENKE